jgi:hypothetical protein
MRSDSLQQIASDVSITLDAMKTELQLISLRVQHTRQLMFTLIEVLAKALEEHNCKEANERPNPETTDI